MRARSFLPALALSLSLSLSWASLAHAQTQSLQQAFADDVPLPILQSLSYVDIEKGRALTLSHGVYRDERRTLRLLTTIVQGDLDGDGTRDAVVLLEDTIGGTTTLHLSAVVQRAGRVRNMASWRLGEHVEVKSLAVENGAILLSLLAMGEGDLPAQPTVKMLVGLKLNGSEIQLMRREPKGRLAAGAARYSPANWD